MIREIINFTENLIEDIPDIMEWNVKPSRGIHIFIDIDDEGQWINQELIKEKDFEFYDGEADLSNFMEKVKAYHVNSLLVNTDMNKCLDNDIFEDNGIKYPIKQIQSCSPYVVGFKRKKPEQFVTLSNNEEEIKIDRFDVISKRATKYLSKSIDVCELNEEQTNRVDNLSKNIWNIIESIKSLEFSISPKKTITTNELSENDFIIIYLRGITNKELKRSYNQYLTKKLFLKNKYNSDNEIGDSTYGVSFFMTVDNDDKPFLKHQTGLQYEGINYRFPAKDVKNLFKFSLLLDSNILPNPLPICIDKNEFMLNSEIIKIFKGIEYSNYRYSEMIGSIFQQGKKLQNYYLLNRQGSNIIDFDFVTSFRFELNLRIENITEIMSINGDKQHGKEIRNIFQLEHVFNDLFLKYEKNTKKGSGFLIGNYFGDKTESQNSFRNYLINKETLSTFYKYRKCIYDYIYKSKIQAITIEIFEEIVLGAVMVDLSMDEYQNNRHTKYYSLKEKLNIWFSLYNLFKNNNLKENTMASKVPDLMSKMRIIAKGESNFEQPEEFAFGAGQIVSYLIDRSAASNKTYAMLEPFLQKTKSNQLQDAIAQMIAIYKHDIIVCKGKFERLSAQVLIDNCDAEMKPLLKFFLAGCFCPCVIYESDK